MKPQTDIAAVIITDQLWLLRELQQREADSCYLSGTAPNLLA